MSKSNPEFTDELISAYLDGELSDQQRRIVEQEMEREPRYRQMFDELVALRNTLHSLPQHQLDAAFHEGVMERVLKGEPTTPKPAVDPSISRDPMWRRFVWSGAAIAAAILVMVLTQGWNSDLQVSVQNTVQEAMDNRTDSAEMMPPIAKTPTAGAEGAEWKAAPTPQQNLRKGRGGAAVPERGGAGAPERSGAQPKVANPFKSAPSFGSSDIEERPEATFDGNQPTVDSQAPGALTASNDDLGVDAVIYVSAPLKLSSPNQDYLLVEGSPAQITEVLEQIEAPAVKLGAGQDRLSSNDTAAEPKSVLADETDSEASVAERQEVTQDTPQSDSSSVRLRQVEANSVPFKQLEEILNQDLEVLDLENLSADGSAPEAGDEPTGNEPQEAIGDDEEDPVADDVKMNEDPRSIRIPIFQLATDVVDQQNIVGSNDDDARFAE